MALSEHKKVGENEPEWVEFVQPVGDRGRPTCARRGRLTSRLGPGEDNELCSAVRESPRRRFSLFRMRPTPRGERSRAMEVVYRVCGLERTVSSVSRMCVMGLGGTGKSRKEKKRFGN